MAFRLIDDGYLVLKVRHMIRRTCGMFFYQRKVPRDLQGHYGKTVLIRKSLGRDATKAATAAAKLAREHDALWKNMRSRQGQDLGLTTPEARTGGAALLAKWGHNPGDRLDKDGFISKTFDNDTILEHFERRYGPEYVEALYDEGHGVVLTI